MNILIRTSLVGLLALPLAAQESGFGLKGGVILGLDSLKKATNGTTGFTLGADYRTHITGTEIPARIGLSLSSMPGKTTGGPTAYSWVWNDGTDDHHEEGVIPSSALKTSLTLAQLHGDVFITTPLPELQAFVGLSLNSYSAKKSGNEVPGVPAQGLGQTDESYEAQISAFHEATTLDAKNHFAVRDAKGLKLGLRLGLTYAFSKHMSAELLLQQTELSGKDLEDPLVRQAGINPAWVELGIRWHF